MTDEPEIIVMYAGELIDELIKQVENAERKFLAMLLSAKGGDGPLSVSVSATEKDVSNISADIALLNRSQ
jgi:hypothetical protein